MRLEAGEFYGRGELVHKSWPCRVADMSVKLFWVSKCGAKIPSKNPYSQSATQWRFVTCKKCLEKK